MGSWQLAMAGDISGTVTLKGTPIPEKPIEFTDACGPLPHAVKTTRWFVLGKDNGLADVFVYISKGLPDGKTYPIPGATVDIDQTGCMYYPYVMGAMVGQAVRFKNSDPFMHNVHGMPEVNLPMRNSTSPNRARATSTIPNSKRASPSRRCW